MKRFLKISSLKWFLLLIPAFLLLQQFVKMPRLKSLKGAFEKEAAPKLTTSNWFNRSFQDQFEKYNNQNFGYRSTAVRVRNQIKHSVFNESTNTGILRFPDNYLIGQDYLDAYLGKDLVDIKRIKDKCRLFKQMYNYLEAKDKQLVIIIAPDKTSYFPEKFGLPPYKKTDSTNYNTWVFYLEQYEVPFIDFRKTFVKAKETTPYPLFSMSGIHWSVYGMRFAIDSIAGFANVNGGFSIPRMNVKNVQESRNYQAIEYDIENALNLFFKFRKPPLGYQNFTMTKGKKAKMMMVSDSFFYEMYSSGLASQYFEQPNFWYYNKTALQWKNPDMDKDTKKQNLLEVLNNIDVLCLMATDPNLNDFPWGFHKRFEEDVLMAQDTVSTK